MSYSETLDNLIRHVGDYRDQYIAEMAEAKQSDLIKALFELRVSVRWYQLTGDQQIKELWSKVRGDVELTDYVIRGTSALLMRFHENQAQWNNLTGQMAEAIGWVANDPRLGSEITERAPRMDQFKTAINGSPWLLFLYVETLTPQVRP